MASGGQPPEARPRKLKSDHSSSEKPKNASKNVKIGPLLERETQKCFPEGTTPQARNPKMFPALKSKPSYRRRGVWDPRLQASPKQPLTAPPSSDPATRSPKRPKTSSKRLHSRSKPVAGTEPVPRTPNRPGRREAPSVDGAKRRLLRPCRASRNLSPRETYSAQPCSTLSCSPRKCVMGSTARGR